MQRINLDAVPDDKGHEKLQSIEDQEQQHHEEVSSSGGFRLDLSFITKETGEGSIEEYTDHAMNFNQSKAMAHILRGLCGLFDSSLNFAIVDIFVGMLHWGKSKAGDRGVSRETSDPVRS